MASTLRGHTLVLIILNVVVCCMLSGCNSQRRENKLSDKVPEIEKSKEAVILTVFFGLDNALPPRSRILHRKAPGKDGMPIVFSQEVDPKTLQASDFEVTSKNGTVYTLEAVTLASANEEFELRTALLIGDYGDYPDNPPVSVKVVGDLLSRSGQNFKGQTKSVIPLENGPILSYAEYFTFTYDYPFVVVYPIL